MANKPDKRPIILIAVVDDHIYTATAIAQELENKGFKTIQAYNGPDAIRLCNEHKPDLVLLDVMLAGKSGFEVANALKGTKILFMTGDEELFVKAKNAKGCVGVIKKPVDMNELIIKIKTLFRIG